MPTVLNTRTRPNDGTLTLALNDLGYEVTEAPLLMVEPTRATPPDDAARACALFITSLHAVEAASTYRDRPVYAVGTTTARALHDAGFSDIRTGPGEGRALADMVIADGVAGHVLYPCAETVSFDAVAHWRRHGIEGVSWPVYRTGAAPMPPAIAAKLKAGAFDHIIVTSARSAKALATIVPKPVGDTRLAVMSDNIRDALPPRWHARTRVAGEPNQVALLSLLRGK